MSQEVAKRRPLFRVHRSRSPLQERQEIGLLEILDAQVLDVDPSNKRADDPPP
jgi:hypothetical protein